LWAARSAARLPGIRFRLDGARREPWVERWQRTLLPMRIGRSFLVVPEGRRAPAVGGRRILRVRFGQAFGTGEHASTRLCLALLEDHLRRGDRVADVGAGTGLLAMAAASLGARDVVAIDDDPVAIAVARANLRANRFGGRVRLRRAEAASIAATGRFDLILMNIGRTVIDRSLPGLAAALTGGGTAILAGFLIEDMAALAARARACGLRAIDRRRRAPWAALAVRRPPQAAGALPPAGRLR
jgi:ribosomal protein L11 methyltransferase